MTDPLDVLREALVPVDPDPSFALRLRTRLERALELPRGVAVTTTIQTSDRLTVTDREPVATGAAIPYLAVRDGRAAIDWYVEVFGAVVLGDPIVMPDGRVGHAELSLAGGKIYLADEFPDIGVVGPSPEGASVSLVLPVTGIEDRVAAATDRGARLMRGIDEAYGSRNATIVDPFGHRWMLQQALTTVPVSEAPPAPWQQGDLGYVSVWAPDLARASAFYEAVLGWTYDHSDGQGHQIVGQSMAMGMWGGQDSTSLYCVYAVGDVDAAASRVRAAGGTATAPTEAPYGRICECEDDRGRRFGVYTPAGDPGRRPPLNGEKQGDLAYLTYEVVDSAPTRAFYGATIGWDFTPGRVNDGWEVSDVVPMSGIGGGAARFAAVPMWLVDDVEAAALRVRAAGGTATDPERQPYGLTSECSDDQGMRFYLGQL